jgi:hypothetical protein
MYGIKDNNFLDNLKGRSNLDQGIVAPGDNPTAVNKYYYYYYYYVRH